MNSTYRVKIHVYIDEATIYCNFDIYIGSGENILEEVSKKVNLKLGNVKYKIVSIDEKSTNAYWTYGGGTEVSGSYP